MGLVFLLADDVLEHIEDQGIELATSLLPHRRERLLDGQRVTVDTVGRERVEHVGDRCDAALERNRLPGEAVGIAVSVPALVVDERNRRRQLENLRRGATQEPVADLGMALHRAPLLVGEVIALEQDLVGDGDLADVVQRAGVAQQPAALLVEAQPPRDQLAHPRHSLGVVAGLRIAELGCVGELANRLGLSTAELELGAAQPGDRVEELLLGRRRSASSAWRLSWRRALSSAIDATLPNRSRSAISSCIEAGRVAAREADHAEDAFGSTQRRADDRAHRHRPELLRSAHVAPLVGDRQRLVARGDPTRKPLPDLDREPDLRGELTDPGHDRERLAVGLEQVEKRVLDADERCRPGQDQAEQLRHLAALGNEQRGLVQCVELCPGKASVRRGFRRPIGRRKQAIEPAPHSARIGRRRGFR